jgi:membrane glycosyltransferase
MKKIYIELKWAVIFTITILCWMLLERTLGWHEEQIANHQWLTLLFAPFSILMYLLEMREKRRRVYGGKMTWIQGFITGVILSVFIALLSPLAQYITHNFITPKYFNNVIEYSVTNDLMTRTKANEFFNINNYILQSAFGALGLGIATAAVVAIFVRKK